MELLGYSQALLNATWITVHLAFTSLVVGLVLAVIFALGESSKLAPVRWLTSAWVTVIRGLPELLVVLFIFFGSSQILFYLTGEYVEVSPFICGVIALALIFASYASQTLRGALKAVPKGQLESCQALGLSPGYSFRRIIFPQALRHALPGLTNQWLVLLKDTALISLIGVTDLLKQAQLTAAATHQSFTWYAIIAVIYLVITLLTQKGIDKLNHRYQLNEANY
ncbi:MULTISPECIES: arginine ABC transporter permease ArtQ [unclassified Vibrio]|uniref:Arginine ABC transporter permease ArtQ n=1 Tax=Vibrio sp. HB236076 TaxID=3232307 RepID=A0AB39HHP2_9VIBR|nr:arginine ABC transporter permease ArtQ [Vibrio sp. HB161653]MDP5253204.1 arginine ABC transporter permease ArtQ [Vibrio sp. HB161653]